LFVAAVLVVGCGDGQHKTETVAHQEAPKSEGKPPATAPAAPAVAAKFSAVDAKGTDWSAHMGSIEFATDWHAAMAAAKAAKKPLMFLFTEKKNADAAKMGAGAFKDPRVVAASKDFVTALVDAEADAPLAERYNVRGVPTIVYTDAAGEACGNTTGASAADEVLRDIQGALNTLKDDAEEQGK
jgi:hypothetical protein